MSSTPTNGSTTMPTGLKRLAKPLTREESNKRTAEIYDRSEARELSTGGLGKTPKLPDHRLDKK